MKYQQPYGVSDPNAAYVNGNPATGTMGSIPPAASIEYPQRELVNFFGDCALIPADNDLHQLSRSIQTGRVIFGIDTGAANVLQVPLVPPLAAYYDGMFIWVRVKVTNTGPSTIAVNALGAKNIVRRGGATLEPGDMPAGYMSLLCYSNLHGNFELYSANFAPASGVPILAANSNLYVNGTTGSDTLYDGTTAAVSGPHGPFKTIQRAVDETFKYGPSVFTMTIHVAAGTYNEAVKTPTLVGPTVIIDGAGITSTFVTGANGRMTFQCTNANTMVVSNLCGSCDFGGVGPPSIFTAYSNATVITQNTASRGCPTGYVWYASGASIGIGNHTHQAGYNISVGAAVGFGGSLGWQQDAVITFQGACNVGFAYAWAVANGAMQVPNPGRTTYVGAGFVTGTKFYGNLNGVLNTQGAGINFFPGTVAGVLISGAQYD